MTRRIRVLLLSGLLGMAAGIGIPLTMAAADGTPPVHFTNEQDRQRLLDLLKITSLRPGRNGSDTEPELRQL